MKSILNLVFIVLFLYTVPVALMDWTILALGLDQLANPWLATMQIVIWSLWISVEFMILGMWQLGRKPYKRTV